MPHTGGVFKGTAVVMLFCLFLFFGHNHVAPHKLNKKVKFMAIRAVQMERKVDAQPLEWEAFTEAAEPCIGPVFIISTMAAVFNTFVLCVWIIWIGIGTF